MRLSRVAFAFLVGTSACATKGPPVAIGVDGLPSTDWLITWVVVHRTNDLGGQFMTKEARVCREQLGELVCRPTCGKGTDLDCPWDIGPGANKEHTIFRGVRLIETPAKQPKSFSILERRAADGKIQGLWARVCTLGPKDAGPCFDSTVAEGGDQGAIDNPDWFAPTGRLDRVTILYLQEEDHKVEPKPKFQRAFECSVADDNHVFCSRLAQLESLSGMNEGSTEPPPKPAVPPPPITTPAPAPTETAAPNSSATAPAATEQPPSPPAESTP